MNVKDTYCLKVDREYSLYLRAHCKSKPGLPSSSASVIPAPSVVTRQPLFATKFILRCATDETRVARGRKKSYL